MTTKMTRRTFLKGAAAAAAAVSLSGLLTGCGAKTEEAPWQTAYRETGKYLQEQDTLSAGSVGGEWAVIGLSRAGLLSDETAQSYE